MATIFPAALPSHRISMGLRREVEVIQRLAESLPEDYEVFHHVLLHEAAGESDRHGEVDVMVLSPQGALLLMEVKSGELEVRHGRMFKRYQDSDCDVHNQMSYQLSALFNRQKAAGIRPYTTHCLVLPDWKLAGGGTVSLPPERIIDASDYERLGLRVRELLAGGWPCPDVEAVRRFLRNEFEVIPDLGALQGQLHATVRTLADGLANWVPRITAPAGVMQIQATAGSGKTQLALRLLEEAHLQGKTCLYVCFNRPLADRLLTIAPDPDCVITFHELCINHFRRVHGEPDFSKENVFTSAAQDYVQASASLPARFALIVVDEAQDFESEWISALANQLVPEGQLVLLGDEDQRLYQREPWEIPNAVLVESYDNFRSPRMVCETINAFALASRPIRSLCPYIGEVPGIHEYGAQLGLFEATSQAVQSLLARGFKAQDIVVVTGRGLRHSRLLQAERIANLAVRRFTGRYDTAGNPLFTKGDLLVESVYRFKGQSAAAVVLSEFDFEALDDIQRRKLFVGMTRGQLAVELVLSTRAHAVLETALTRS